MKNVWYYATLTAIGILVVSVTILRAEESDGPFLARCATAAFLAGMTLGPSLLSREVFSRLAPVSRNRRLCRLLEKNIKRDKQRCDRAAERIEQRALHAAWWDEQSAMLTAAYRLAYIEKGGVPPTNPYRTS